jgi:hypothetical protein
VTSPFGEALRDYAASWPETHELLGDDPTRVQFVVSRAGLRWPLLAVADDDDARIVAYSISPDDVPRARQHAALEWVALANQDLIVAAWEVRLGDGGVRCRTAVDLLGVPDDLLADRRLIDFFVADLIAQNIAVARRYLPGLLRVCRNGADPRTVIAEAEA